MSTTLAPPPAAAADLVLVRMALSGMRPRTPGAVRKDVGKLLLGREWTADEYAAVRDDLVAAGLVVKAGRSFAITDAGRERALRFLGVHALPPRTTWKNALARLLFPKLAGLSPDAAGRLASGDRLAALLLRRKYDLPDTAGDRVADVLEALACQQLGHSEETTLEGLMRRTICRRVLKTDDRLTAKELAKQLPLFETGLTKGTADEIRQAIIRSALLAEPEPPAEFDLATFARTVRALARTRPPADRFHDNKVFIAAVWRASQREPGFPRLSLDQFKDRLVEANRDGLLRLSRADLVQAMDPARLAESETHYLNAAFHFVLVEGDSP